MEEEKGTSEERRTRAAFKEHVDLMTDVKNLHHLK